MATCTKCGHAAGAEMIVEAHNGKTTYYFACLRCRNTEKVSEIADDEKAALEAEMRAEQAEHERRMASDPEYRAAEEAWDEYLASSIALDPDPETFRIMPEEDEDLHMNCENCTGNAPEEDE